MSSFRNHFLATCTLGILVLLASPAAQSSGQVIAAAGQRQWIDCQGTGSPTVVISSGLDADHRMWSKVLAPMRAITRTCIYDRPGLGSSPKRVGSLTTDAGQQAQELRALLAAAGETGPYVLVAHSYAGLISRSFAAQDESDLAGMLLLDAVFPGIHRNFAPSYRGNWHEGGTTIDMSASERATHGGPDLGALPLIVLTAGSPHGKTSNDRRWNAEQRTAAKLSRNSLHWYAVESGHVIQQDDPARVISAVKKLVAAARSRDPLN